MSIYEAENFRVVTDGEIFSVQEKRRFDHGFFRSKIEETWVSMGERGGSYEFAWFKPFIFYNIGEAIAFMRHQIHLKEFDKKKWVVPL